MGAFFLLFTFLARVFTEEMQLFSKFIFQLFSLFTPCIATSLRLVRLCQHSLNNGSPTTCGIKILRSIEEVKRAVDRLGEKKGKI